jgi:hypothetical protein
MKAAKKRPEKGDAMVALNVRDFPADLRWACNAKASLLRMTLAEFVRKTLEDATADVKLA